MYNNIVSIIHQSFYYERKKTNGTEIENTRTTGHGGKGN